LGAGRPKEARKVILIALFIATSEGLSMSLLLVLLRNIWGKLYSNETKVVKYVANILPLVAICHIVDSIQCLFSGMYMFLFIYLHKQTYQENFANHYT
jgi:MATE family multidrug resistance protein